ncbi:hypothetical protein [Roseibium aggregatum]|uniref:Alpha/beta hydrolase n=1 Tax=Roseibium aggregatum TaxID=187304 RepID=A0A926S8I4_9HYPH|nr:hypothetical protein [Roseibium aggregatum]MBD1549580.1 hypothetical protein [Roseibium aggregatum]
MRLAFIHGINNEGNTPEGIADTWWQALVEGWKAIGLPPKPRPQIDVGYYGKLLADAVAGRRPAAVAQGGGAESRDVALEFLKTYQAAAGISDEELNRALLKQGLEREVVEQGRIRGALLDVASAIESLLPAHGKSIASRFLKQATHYVEDTGLAAQIGVIVRKAVFDGHDEPVLLVSHSLGTVVAYKMLAESRVATRQVPLFVTLGSPLGIGMMQQILPPRRTIPNPPIGQWLNGFRQDDVVTLGRPLIPGTLGLDGITNVSDGLIEETDKHSIHAYLKSPPICGHIYGMLP